MGWLNRQHEQNMEDNSSLEDDSSRDWDARSNGSWESSRVSSKGSAVENEVRSTNNQWLLIILFSNGSILHCLKFYRLSAQTGQALAGTLMQQQHCQEGWRSWKPKLTTSLKRAFTCLRLAWKRPTQLARLSFVNVSRGFFAAEILWKPNTDGWMKIVEGNCKLCRMGIFLFSLSLLSN